MPCGSFACGHPCDCTTREPIYACTNLCCRQTHGTPCAAGTYNNDASALACTSCPFGISTPQTGSLDISSCTICAPGFYGTVTNGGTLNAAGCSVCPAGYYSPANSNACTACSIGFTTYSRGSTSVVACTACAQGFYRNGGGCTPCPPGLSTITFGSESLDACVSCAEGYTRTATGGCTICLAGTWGQFGMNYCLLCPPGTYSLAGASTCTPCPAGTYGSSAGLTSSACTGPCASLAACPLGTAYPPPAAPITGLSCASSGVRAVPSSLGLLLWPAAHPSNPQRVDLVIAPLAMCQQLGGTCSTLASNTVVGADGIMRYIVGTAAALNIEAAEALACSAL